MLNVKFQNWLGGRNHPADKQNTCGILGCKNKPEKNRVGKERSHAVFKFFSEHLPIGAGICRTHREKLVVEEKSVIVNKLAEGLEDRFNNSPEKAYANSSNNQIKRMNLESPTETDNLCTEADQQQASCKNLESPAGTVNLCTEADDQPAMCFKTSAIDSQEFSSQSTSFSNTSDGILAKSLVAKSTNQEKLE